MASPLKRPFLKWAGGKMQSIPFITQHLPKQGRLIEPFVGSGAVFLNTHYTQNLLSDINPDLINLYKTLQKKGNDFIDYANQYFTKRNNTKTAFYRLREQFNHSDDINERSALFIYLNRHCYNGLCRYNAEGVFNVPFGSYKNPLFPRKAMLDFYERAQYATFTCTDFASTLKRAKKGDVIYCDPPYIPLTKTANFTQYSGHAFGEEHQLNLAKIANRLAKRNITVLLSNHDTPTIRKNYHGAKIYPLNIRRSISCTGNNRASKTKELLAIFDE